MSVYFFPMVQDSKHLTESENKIIDDLYGLCSSVARLELDNPKKEHIRKSVNALLSKTLNKKVQS